MLFSCRNNFVNIADPQADTSPLEREIFKLVYQLYGLTEDEVKVVEGKE